MDIKNALSIADAITEADKRTSQARSQESCEKKRMQTSLDFLYGTTYLLLVEPVEDAVCGFIIYAKRNPLISIAVAATIRNFHKWTEEARQEYLEAFKKIAEGNPEITTAEEATTRTHAFMREYISILSNQQKKESIQKALDDFNKQNLPLQNPHGFFFVSVFFFAFAKYFGTKIKA